LRDLPRDAEPRRVWASSPEPSHNGSTPGATRHDNAERTPTGRRMNPAAVRLAPAPEPEAGNLLSPGEAARRLGLTRRTLLDIARRGAIPFVCYRRGRDGRVTLCAFDPADLDRYVAAHRQEATRP
jgi:excisionase family DNA binding protein